MDSLDRFPLVQPSEELGVLGPGAVIYLVDDQPATYFTYRDERNQARYYGALSEPHRLHVRVVAPISNDWQLLVNPHTRSFTLFRTNGREVLESETSPEVKILNAAGDPQTLRFAGDEFPLFEFPARGDGWQTGACKCYALILLLIVLLVVMVLVAYEIYAGERTVRSGQFRL